MTYKLIHSSRGPRLEMQLANTQIVLFIGNVNFESLLVRSTGWTPDNYFQAIERLQRDPAVLTYTLDPRELEQHEDI